MYTYEELKKFKEVNPRELLEIFYEYNQKEGAFSNPMYAVLLTEKRGRTSGAIFPSNSSGWELILKGRCSEKIRQDDWLCRRIMFVYKYLDITECYIVDETFAKKYGIVGDD